MSIKRFFASADATIANSYKIDGYSTTTKSNIGAASSLELYSLYGSHASASVESSRILMKFPISDISSSRATGLLPNSGSINFFLRIYNVEHPFSLPEKYFLQIAPLKQDWEEGYGVDLDTYIDPGVSGSFGTGVTWDQTGKNTYWEIPGGKFDSSSYNYSYYINKGDQDIELDITSLIESQIAGNTPNYGIIIKLSGSYEDGTQLRSYYTKRFSARETNFFYSKPNIEARWDDSLGDNRSGYKTFLPGMLPSEANNTIYFYNKPLGYLSNLSTAYGALNVKLYAVAEGTQEVIPSYLSYTNPSQGIYKAVFRTTASFPNLYDRWYEGGGSGVIFYKGVLTASTVSTRDDISYNEEQVLNITNLKPTYKQNETCMIKVFTRKKNWQPNIYSVASNNIENVANTNLYYRLFRLVDNYEVVPYGTGSIPYTKSSYDKNGNYFNLDMSIFEPGYAYGIKFGLLEGAVIREFKESFRFKVE